MSSVVVRKAQTSDLNFVADLGMRTLPDSVASYKKSDPLVLAKSFAMLQSFVLERPHEIVIAECDGRRAGFAMLLTAYEDEVTLTKQAFLAFLAVEPTMRQKRVGSHLLQAVEETAREHGLPHLTLMVTRENNPAIKLYEAAGYGTERPLMYKIL